MAEMASWFKTPEGFVFLTDDDVYAHNDYHDHSDKEIPWNNLVGHWGIINVFKVADRYNHDEGFVDMPDVIRKHILDGKMDMLFAHAGNLIEATPEFIYTMKRLANRFPSVESQLNGNPYRKLMGRTISIKEQLEIGIEHRFRGSSVGSILKRAECDEDSMLLTLEKGKYYLDMHSDYRYYYDIMKHANVTKKVLTYVADNIKHPDVVAFAKTALETFPTTKKKIKMAEAVVTEITTKKFGKNGIVRSLA